MPQATFPKTFQILILAGISFALCQCIGTEESSQNQESGKIGVPGCDAPGGGVDRNPNCRNPDSGSETSNESQSEMHFPRGGHVAVRLKSGKVLVLGGLPLGFDLEETSEIYDPTSNTWTKGPKPAINNRHWARGVLLDDGRVLIVGGATIFSSGPSYGKALSRTEIEVYNPSNNQFELIANSTNPRAGASVTKLKDGRILILGGANGPSTSMYADGEIFDPTTNQLHSISGVMSLGRRNHNAVVMESGDVLITGGLTLNGVTSQVDLFRITDETISSATSLSLGLADHFSALLPSGRILLAGGWTDNVVPSTSVQTYIDESFQMLPDLPKKVFNGSAITLSDGRLVFAGGDESTNGSLRHGDIFVYDLENDSFEMGGTLKDPRSNHSLTELNDGSVLASGGFTSGYGWNYTNSAERFRLNEN
ncbi:MAG: Kelch repeat-containing protein [Bdellovibrionales bacterium]